MPSPVVVTARDHEIYDFVIAHKDAPDGPAVIAQAMVDASPPVGVSELSRVTGYTVDEIRGYLPARAPARTPPPKPAFSPAPGATFENPVGDFYFEGRPVLLSDFQAVRAQLVAQKNALRVSYAGTMGEAWHLSDLAARIASCGIDDIRRIAGRVEERRGGMTGYGAEGGEWDPNLLVSSYTHYTDRKTGAPIEGIGNNGGDSFASTAAGENSNVTYVAKFTSAGLPVFMLRVNKSGFMVEIAPWLEGFAFLLSVVPGLGLAIGQAVAGAVMGSATALANPLIARIIGSTVVNTALNGGDLAGAVAGAVKGAAGSVVQVGAGGMLNAALLGSVAQDVTFAAVDAANTGGDVNAAIEAAAKGATMGDGDWGEIIDYGADPGGVEYFGGDAGVGDTGNYGDDGTGDAGYGDDYGGSDGGGGDTWDAGEWATGGTDTGAGTSGGDTWDAGEWGNGGTAPVGGGADGNVYGGSTAGAGGWGNFADLAKTLVTAGASLAQVIRTFQSGGAPVPLRVGQAGTLANGSRVVHNGNGTMTVTTANGARSVVPEARGTATTLPDGSIAIATGTGSATIVRPNGQTATVSGGGLPATIGGMDTKKVLLYGGIGLGVLLLLRQNRGGR